MPSTAEKAGLVALLRAGIHPWNVCAALVEEAGSALTVLERELDAGTSGRLFTGASHSATEMVDAATAAIERWEATGIHLCTILDHDYPENLKAVHDRPPLIFVAGALGRADARSVAVVGARRATAAGIKRAQAIAGHLVSAGFTVASGLAAGIDTAAHTAALAGGGRTIAVIGTGLERSYPPQNAALQRRIATECAVLSQFWPDSSPSRRSFPMRNAVMSGVALATVVVEASHTSGSRMQARLALQHGRPVFLPRALLSEPWANDLARRPGAYVVTSPVEISETVERLTSAGTLVA